MNLKALVGTTIESVLWDGESIYFFTDKGGFRGTPDGDCCSRCYVQHVSGTDALARGAVVYSVEDIELPELPQEDWIDVSDVWSHRITTSKGVCSIEMRLDHNGYYGGSLSFGSFVPCNKHADCKEHPDLGFDCAGLPGKPIDDF